MLFITIAVLLGAVVVLALTIPSPDPDYKEVLKMSLLFYEAQRSGHLPDSNRIHWRGDSALNDSGDLGEDLVGGYYDANDMVKFGFTMAFSMTMLSWGVLSYEDAYKSIDQYDKVLEAIRWGTDYFIKCHVAPDEFYSQVGDFKKDHEFWGRPEEMDMDRPAYKIDKDHPGSDVAAETSAAMAAASLVFKNVDKQYSEELLKHAMELFEFSKKFRGFYHDSAKDSRNHYENLEYDDEIAWAAIWLYKATNEKVYKKYAEEFAKKILKSLNSYVFWYNKKHVGVMVLLAQQSNKGQYVDGVIRYCDHAMEKFLRTPQGLVYLGKQGTLPLAADLAFICLQVSEVDQSRKDVYIKFAKKQINYMLGSTGRSFVVGFGENYPQRPFHAASSCPDSPAPCGFEQLSSPGPNPQILWGALVSGPHENDHYEDRRYEHLFNEVTLDYNSGFQGVLAGLIHESSL